MEETNKPAFRVMVTREYGAGQTAWTKIGAAFALKDGKGYRVKLDALPVGDEMLLLAEEESDK